MPRLAVLVPLLLFAGCGDGSSSPARPSARAAPTPPPSPCAGAQVSEKPLALTVDGRRRELATRAAVDDTALACAEGRVALAWVEGDSGRRHRLKLLLDGRVMQLAVRQPIGDFDPVLSSVGVAFMPDDALLVAYADGDRVRALRIGRDGRREPRVTLGPAISVTRVVVAGADNGDAVVAWSTFDGGIQVDRPNHVYLAKRPARGEFRPARRLQIGTSVDPDEGGPLDLALAIAPDGRWALMWNDVTGSYAHGGFRHPVMLSIGGRPRSLTPDGTMGAVARDAAGTVLAVFESEQRLRAVVGDADPVDLGRPGPASAFFDADGRPAVALPSGQVLHP